MKKLILIGYLFLISNLCFSQETVTVTETIYICDESNCKVTCFHEDLYQDVFINAYRVDELINPNVDWVSYTIKEKNKFKSKEWGEFKEKCEVTGYSSKKTRERETEKYRWNS